MSSRLPRLLFLMRYNTCMRILVFGDSITYGEFDTQGGWATRLKVDYFNEWVKDPDADPPLLYNLGIGGDVTAHLAKRLPGEVEARKSLWSGGNDFALVIAIGINDSLTENGNDFSSPEQYAKDLQAVYKAARQFSDKLLCIGLTPVEDDNPRANRLYSTARIRQFDQVLRKFAAEKALPFVPFLEVFEPRMQAGEQLFVDGLHPNDTGHELMYQTIKPALTGMLAPENM
jgi:lysophospholipase L1-like esterase